MAVNSAGQWTFLLAIRQPQRRIILWLSRYVKLISLSLEIGFTTTDINTYILNLSLL